MVNPEFIMCCLGCTRTWFADGKPWKATWSREKRYTHGLPVEIEVQKRLDLMSNEAIEAYGMKEFNKACKESVWTYEQAWREMTERMGFWVDMNDPYVTLRMTT